MNRLHFLHIPRTMGTALKDQCLYPNYQHAEVVLDLTWQSALTNKPPRYQNVNLICSHLPINIQSVTGQPYQTFTMLRDPIYRARSMYYFCKRVIWHYLHPAARHMDLVEFALDQDTRPIIQNSYARYLINDQPYQQIADSVPGKAPIRGKLDEKFFSMGLDIPEDELLDRAKEKMESLFFVGVSDEFYKSVQLLWGKLGITEPKLGPDMARQMHPHLRSNIYPLRTPAYEALAAINRVDMELYRLAKQNIQDQ